MADSLKMTFTLDRETVDRIDRTAARLGMPKSGVVREAIAEYAARAGRLSHAEQSRMLAALDAMMKRPPTRTARAVEAELAEIRRARRHGGRRTRSEPDR